MASPQILLRIADAERRQAVGTLEDLLGEEHDDARDNLRRVLHDVGSNPEFATSALVGALARICADQQQRIEELEATRPRSKSKA